MADPSGPSRVKGDKLEGTRGEKTNKISLFLNEKRGQLGDGCFLVKIL